MTITEMFLPDHEYYNDTNIGHSYYHAHGEYNKDGIVLHHTVSRTHPYRAWIYDKKNLGIPDGYAVGTCYAVDRDGTVYQYFKNDKNYAWHIGLGLDNVVQEQRLIGIEFVTMGRLSQVGEKIVDAYEFKQYKDGDKAYTELKEFPWKYDDIGYEWREGRYFDTYTEAQVTSGVELINYLTEKHNIVKDIPTLPFEWNKWWASYKGVLTHVNFRRDKSDISPNFPIDRLIGECGLNRVD